MTHLLGRRDDDIQFSNSLIGGKTIYFVNQKHNRAGWRKG
jgi:hypothetical protein